MNSSPLSLTSLLLLLLVATNGYCQRSYYEYNNPDALRISKKSIDLLASVPWKVKEVIWKIQNDTFNYRGQGTLTFKKDGSFSGYSNGTWTVKYNHYLIIDDNSIVSNLDGIYGITFMADSTMTLTKVHTTARDMSKTMTLVKYDHMLLPVDNDQHQETVIMPTRIGRNTGPITLKESFIDSLTFLSKQELAFLGYRHFNDTLYINTPDTTYKVGMDSYNPLRKVKIFDAGEDIEDYEAYQKFTLSVEQLLEADSLAMKYIKLHRDDYYPQKEIASLDPYFRQYVGYFDVNGDAIVLLNAFCQYKSNWEDSLVQVGLGGICYFNVSINLTKKEAFSFHVNDF
jgi:hypothetical protein